MLTGSAWLFFWFAFVAGIWGLGKAYDKAAPRHRPAAVIEYRG
jgi:hypothetical protein